MKFIFDECISSRIAQALQALGEQAVSSADQWGKGALDLEWIPLAGKQGCCVVTADRLKRHERAALTQHDGRIFLLAVKNIGFWDQVRLVINRWPEIKAMADNLRPPFMVRVTARGKPERII
ncbi:MAG: DUF5615 family PIN-like protein [Planctomycetaceae bacterium]|nr:DUF5615 family PIN-like protein [Planctomycetaceae bacterium]